MSAILTLAFFRTGEIGRLPGAFPVPEFYLPPENVIVRKLQDCREGVSDKHLRDIRSMLSVSGDQIDRTELEDWIRRRGLEPRWRIV